jgi:hypothetical protein
VQQVCWDTLAGNFGDTLGEGRRKKEEERRKKEEGRKIISNAQCPMPNSQFPNSPIPQSKIQNLKSKI